MLSAAQFHKQKQIVTFLNDEAEKVDTNLPTYISFYLTQIFIINDCLTFQ